MTQNVKFIHLRRRDANGVLQPRGGLTLAYEIRGDRICVAQARCSDKDNFSRARGRQIAAGRLTKGADLVGVWFDDPRGKPVEAILNVVPHDGYVA